MVETDVQQKLKVADVVTALETIRYWLDIVIDSLNAPDESAVRNTEFAVDTKPDGGSVKLQVNALGARVGRTC